MAVKNVAEVVIAGRVYKISGYESPEYLHQIAVYLNDKMTELQSMDGYRKQNTDQKQLLLNMNLADDFFKAKRQADKLTADLEKKERELYGVRHDLIEAQLALENQKKELAGLKKQYAELEALLDQSTKPEAGSAEEAGGPGASPVPGTAQPQQARQQSQPRQSHASGRRNNPYGSGNNQNTRQG